VVRHQDDYGILVLADCRFDTDQETNLNLSKWVRDSLSNNAQAFSYPNFVKELTEFQARHFTGPIIVPENDVDNYQEEERNLQV
jgi:hypothetical protein